MQDVSRKAGYDAAMHKAMAARTVLNRAAEATSALDHTVLAMEKLAIHIASVDYANVNPCDACGRKGLTPQQSGQTLAYFAKMVNEITRLMEFAKGEADSRTEVTGLGDLLKQLSNEQATQVRSWFEEAQTREISDSH